MDSAGLMMKRNLELATKTISLLLLSTDCSPWNSIRIIRFNMLLAYYNTAAQSAHHTLTMSGEDVKGNYQRCLRTFVRPSLHEREDKTVLNAFRFGAPCT